VARACARRGDDQSLENPGSTAACRPSSAPRQRVWRGRARRSRRCVAAKALSSSGSGRLPRAFMSAARVARRNVRQSAFLLTGPAPLRSGVSQRGLRCVSHRRRSLASIGSGSGTRRSLSPCQ
jgi:hypothetical protein